MTADDAASRAHPRTDVAPLAVLGGLLGLYGWLVFAMAFHHDGLIGPYYNAPGGDYMVYWTGVRAAQAGEFGLLADPAALTVRLNETFRSWLTAPMPLHAWLYPPHFLLFLLPFAALPFGQSYALFELATFAAAAAGAMCWAGPARRRLPWLIGLALSPAATVNVLAGQNGFLTLALLLGGMGLIGRYDIAGGVLLGLLSFKPQFAVLVPVALLALRNWRALGAAAAGAALAAAASAAAFGLDAWRLWLGSALDGGGPHYADWVAEGRLWGLSIWTFARLAGAPEWLANVCQALAVLVGAACVWVAFRRPVGRDRRMAVLLVATLVAAPHLSYYDLVLLAAAVLLLFRALLDGERLPLRPSLLLLPWAAAFIQLPHASPAGLAEPAIMLGLLAALMVPARA